MKCPTHDTDMIPQRTQYGFRHQCVILGCTMVAWDGPTSTPADSATRELRRQAHEKFDKLYGPHRRFKSRNAAYRWLHRFMRVQKKDCHIGCFTKEQCQRLINHLSVDQNRFGPVDAPPIVG